MKQVRLFPSSYRGARKAQVTRQVPGRADLTDSGKLDSRSPKGEPLTGVALSRLLLCVELTRFGK